MNSDQLRETTLDLEKRVLYRVTINDAEKMINMLNILMDDAIVTGKQIGRAHV